MFSLIVESFELLVCVLIFNGYKSLTLDQGSDFDCVGVYGESHLLSLFCLLIKLVVCAVVVVAEVWHIFCPMLI